jgi:hypothetical protein
LATTGGSADDITLGLGRLCRWSWRMVFRLAWARRAPEDAIQVLPDFEGPHFGKLPGLSNSRLIVEVDDLDYNVSRFVSPQNADFVFVHGNLPVP